MKIVLFSDIHSNLPAWDSFVEDLEKVQPDSMYCLGDLVGYNIWPNEVVNSIRSMRIPCIAGNHDAVIGIPTDKASGKYTNTVIGTSEKAYLQSLPAHIKLDFHFEKGPLSVLLVHGSPKKNTEYLRETTEDDYLLSLMEESAVDILCFGHTHQQFHKVLKGNDGRYKHCINLGSLGKPKDGDPRGCYAVLDFDAHTNLFEKNGVSVTFNRVTYDVERAATAIESSELPNIFAEALRIAT